ncbi:MAG: leucyl-tRNA synthetase [Flaviaesturariibacter sp.]|nr:leucyl-tRNA synthetase [Flaviaesturariibacter sp.]
MEYNFRQIEQKWQQKWVDDGAYKVPNVSDKPKYYVLDMFPYPSGAGLHVGHPLGYIASDIFARYKRLKGFNVLHPMGYDAFGLPAEQYAIEHGVHPAVSTAKNISTFRSQLDKIGFSFDWSREVNTSHPGYYKWTQWIFLQLFKSFYNRQTQKTQPIDGLIKLFETEGNKQHPIPNPVFQIPTSGSQTFSADDWKSFDEATQQAILMEYRVAYCGYGEVNWCEALGTVLANDEVVNGVSERGGYPVEKKRLRQWYLRITEYGDRLLQGLQTVDFSDAMKEMQSNWIGKSSGAEIEFRLTPSSSPQVERREEPTLEEPYPKYGVTDRLQYENARKNRKGSTEAEAKLWDVLRNSKTGYKFRRQHPVDSFMADFACLQKGLIIEVDGGYHNYPDQKEYDAYRTTVLESKGFILLRFTNEEVLADVYVVRNKIKEVLTNLNEAKAESDPAPLSNRVEEGLGVRCYTTRPDTIFGVDFMVLAPEHELIEKITIGEQRSAVEEYIAYVKSRSERERMSEKKISGVFTGAHVEHPFTGKPIPVWISEYVLAGYGTGAIMAVPSGDERDHKFAQHFGIPITNIFGEAYTGEEAVTSKDLVLHESDFVNGLKYKEAAEIVINKLEEEGIGKRKVNFKIRDAAFSRQRYWGEPFPIKWINGIAYPLDERELPLELPHVDTYKPGPEGEGPLANIPEWYLIPNPSPQAEKGTDSGEAATPLSNFVGEGLGVRETNTMPGYAGSSWYFLRYMDPHNDATFCNKNISDYWGQVDLYVGGTEHAVGHLLYSRMWTKCLYDLGLISFDEPFKKLLNQGMITGKSFFVSKANYRAIGSGESKLWITSLNPESEFQSPRSFQEKDWIKDAGIETQRLKNAHKYLDAYGRLTKSMWEKYKRDHEDLDPDIEVDFETDSENNGEQFISGMVIEKMSKSKFNVENPDDIVLQYGADTFRMYEMFLGPVEMSKPWDTKGIEGVHRFLKKLWRLFAAESGSLITTDTATPAELKVLHKTIKKIEEDTERFSFNTCVSAFMVCVNELTDLKCSKKEVLEPVLILLTPYAPHIAEELWHFLGNTTSILDASFPKLEEKYLVESTKEYPISVNGKLRTTINIELSADAHEVESIVLQNEVVQKWLEGKQPKKIIFVKGKMVNVVTSP